jgi:hypothetical protein
MARLLVIKTMEEIFTGILKGATYLFRVCIENGIWEISIRKPGKLLLKIIWPPFWFKSIDYNGSFTTVLGFFLVHNGLCILLFI